LDQNKKFAGGGWLAGAYESIKHEESIELSLAFPVSSSDKGLHGEIGNTQYYGFSLPKYLKVFPNRALERTLLRKQLQYIISVVNPDILHVFGTEYLHSRVAVECFGKPENTLIHLQGIVSFIAKHCEKGFPFIVKHLFVPSSILRGTIQGQARKWRKAGKDEIVAIQKSGYVMGRTEWDKACTYAINPNATYIHCGETLRSSFYEESSRWRYDTCKKHSIYFSQSSSQVKGLHLVFPILPDLIKHYPDIHLYVGGSSPIGPNNLKGILKRSPLGWYLKHQIKKYKLEKYVTFLGVQNEHQVVSNLKNAHVFLSASLIENSPNSIGEAMVVGTPVVSSDVGGVKDFIKHRENGFIYPVDEPYMIPYYIGKIFDDKELAERFSDLGRESGREKYSAESNGNTLSRVYSEIASQ
jgi:glycosyltransferase involved in cell wall biosynthesis